MNDKLSDQVSQLLDKLGGNAERVWPEMVQAMCFQSTLSVVAGCLLAFVGIVFLLGTGWIITREHDGIDDDLAIVAGLTIGLVGAGVGAALILTNLAGVFYPEATLVARLLK